MKNKSKPIFDYTYYLLQKQCLVIFFLFFNIVIFSQDTWMKYEAPDRSFTISCPGGIMNATVKEVITGVGKLVNKVYYINMADDHPNFLYMVSTVHYPSGTFHKDSLDLIEDYFIQSSISLQESTGCKLQYKLVEVFDEVPNMILRLIDEASGTGIKAKMFLYSDTLYTIQAYTNHDNKLNEFLDQFINSFTINK
jgi:hypothetical protein